jgi:hypothetical protein
MTVAPCQSVRIFLDIKLAALGYALRSVSVLEDILRY